VPIADSCKRCPRRPQRRLLFQQRLGFLPSRNTRTISKRNSFGTRVHRLGSWAVVKSGKANQPNPRTPGTSSSAGCPTRMVPRKFSPRNLRNQQYPDRRSGVGSLRSLSVQHWYRAVWMARRSLLRTQSRRNRIDGTEIPGVRVIQPRFR